MYRLFSLTMLIFLWNCGAGGLDYPESKQVDQVDVLHGVEVRDPYRWLEDLDSQETRDWIEAQNELTFGYLEALPRRQELQNRLSELWNYEKYGVPRREGDRYFYSYNPGLENQSLIYRLESLDEEPVLVLDPNRFSEDGTEALTFYEVSPSGEFMAYGVSSGGSDWQEWKIRSVDTGEDLSDHLRWIKFSSASWAPDSSGFYYSRYDAPSSGDELEETNYYHKVYYHEVGTAQAQDRLIYERPDQKEWLFSAEAGDDGRYLVIEVLEGTREENGVFLLDLEQPDSEVLELLNQFDASYGFLGNEKNRLWFRTNLDAPRYRVIEIDLEQPARENWKTIVPEAPETLEQVELVNQQLVCVYLEDARNRVSLFNLDGTPAGTIDLPGIGSASGFTGESEDSETFFSFTSFSTPPQVFRFDFETGESSLLWSPNVAFDPTGFETTQVFLESRDGTRIPMFVSHRAGLELNGAQPTLLYGYGGFNISQTPRFSVSNLAWMEAGGVYALANIRGGGEYGRDWHEAGRKKNKQNVFDDFIAAAEWLIEHNYTSSEQLAVEGGSNGGLLVGAVITQRPELFGAAVPHVGVMDMLRFHKFTIGWAWVSDYGSPDRPEDFETLLAYSPYHNIEPDVEYPATLIMTADRDDRVVPSHSFKFAARLQQAQAGSDPVLIRIETRAGHGAGKPTSKRIEAAADKLAFLLHELE